MSYNNTIRFLNPWQIKYEEKKKKPAIRKDRVYLQPGLEESSFNPLRGKQKNHPHVYFKKSHDSLKMSCD